MKKHSIFAGSLILSTIFFCILMITGCQQVPKSLSEEEIATFNKELFYDETHNMNNMLLSSEYNDPKEIDLFQLFYNGVGQGTAQVSENELAQLTELYKGAHSLDIVKVTTEEMDAFLQEHLGLGLEETQKKGLDTFYYLKEYDSYYLVHGDTNYDGCTVISGIQESDHMVTLKYKKKFAEGQWFVTLQKTDDGYWFVSNLRAD